MTWRSEAPKRRSRGKQAGFSLAEMLVVLVVIGLVTALAAPALRDASGERALDRGVREMAALLREARAQAVLSGSDTIVSVDLDGRDVSADWTEERIELPEGVSLAVLTTQEELLLSGRPSFRFFADGSATGGAVRLQNRDVEWLVSVDWLTGRVERNRDAR